MQDDLGSLIAAWPLPPGYSAPQVFADEIEIAGTPIRRAGMQSTAPSGEEVTGSAAVLEGSPMQRAYFELLERAALIDAANHACSVRDAAGQLLGVAAPAPAHSDERSRAARSNGVALHRTWQEACRRAHCELTERDRILGAWYGELPLVPVATPSWLSAFTVTHDWIARSVPPAGRADVDVQVAMVFGFPRQPDVPLARGFAADATLESAVTAAAQEAIQSLAFVWDEPVPVAPPQLAPTPLFHLDYYLWPGSHAALREWLDSSVSSAPGTARSTGDDETQFIDLTPPTFGETLRVARAVRKSARELIFGEPSAQLQSVLPKSRHVHPIP